MPLQVRAVGARCRFMNPDVDHRRVVTVLMRSPAVSTSAAAGSGSGSGSTPAGRPWGAGYRWGFCSRKCSLLASGHVVTF